MCSCFAQATILLLRRSYLVAAMPPKTKTVKLKGASKAGLPKAACTKPLKKTISDAPSPSAKVRGKARRQLDRRCSDEQYDRAVKGHLDHFPDGIL